MYERFTDRACKTMQLANQEAQRLNHAAVDTGHVLLGLCKEGSGVAANVLKNLDVDLHKIRVDTEKLVPAGEGVGEIGKLPLTPGVKKIIEGAIEEAKGLSHNYVGTEHLLLGLLHDPESVACQVLTNLGLSLQQVRDEVLLLLGPVGEADGEAAGVPVREVFEILRQTNRERDTLDQLALTLNFLRDVGGFQRAEELLKMAAKAMPTDVTMATWTMDVEVEGKS